MPETRLDRLNAINEELKRIHRAYNDTFEHGFDDKKIFDTFDIQWNSVPVTLYFTMHRELISYTIYIHADRAGNSRAERVGKLKDYFANIMAVAAGGSRADLPTCHKYLFEGIWTDFFNDNNAIPRPCSSWPFGAALAKPRVIADFRGLIIGSAAYASSDRIETADVDNLKIADSLFPFLCCRENSNSDDFSICTMKGWRAFHASTLGESSGAHAEDTHRYMIYSHSLTPMALGELVNIGHRLGIARLAAILLLPNLDEATELLRQIERKIDGTFRLLSERGWDEDIQNRIHAITFGDFVRLNGMFDGNIRERLELSLWYKERFDTLISRLEIYPLGEYKTFKTKTNEMVKTMLERADRLLTYYGRIIEEYHKICNLACVEETADRNTKIVDLQVNAELILFCALVPYYLPNVVSHTVKAVFDIDEHEHHLVDRLSWPFFLALGIWWTLGSLAERKPSSQFGMAARRIRLAVKRWFELFAQNVLLVVPTVFAAIWAYVVIHFHLPERLAG
ncbi:MAG: hypothetical protein ACREDT_13225 [Methylocella sp.]